MNRQRKPITAIVALVAIAIVVALVALRGTIVVTAHLNATDIGQPGGTVPSGGPIAVVIGKQHTGGPGLLGFGGGPKTYRLTVSFDAPPSCLAFVVPDAPWPPMDIECTSDVPIDGVVSGGGVAADGEAT